jgi:2-polyprenyl-3-methyl-5-hydroxy-6-metoxy-1,4-benzoquinol methylase
MSQRWFTENDDSHSQWYADHFRELSANGVDISGEARLLDAIVPPGSCLLDAGCGQGRTAGALAARGHQVVAVDIDETLLQAAEADHPGPIWRFWSCGGNIRKGNCSTVPSALET